MKYIIILLIGVALVATVLPDKRVSNSNLDKTESKTSSIASPELKAEEVKEPVKDTPNPTPPVDVVKDNPNKCDTNVEWIYPDGTCHKKQAESIASSTTAPTASSSGGCELVRNYTNWNVDVAYAVCMAESGGNTNAANYNDNHGKCVGSFGLMQLACFWIPNPTDPTANMAKANEIWSRSGWSPWGAYTSGKYLKYL